MSLADFVKGVKSKFFNNDVVFSSKKNENSINVTGDNLGDSLLHYPELAQDRLRIRSILLDKFSNNKLKVNLLMMGYDENIISLANSQINYTAVKQMENKLLKNHGISSENAVWIVQTWLNDIFNVVMTGTDNEVSIIDNTAIWLQNVTSNNYAVPVDELIELFNDAFESESNNSDEIWEYVDRYGDYNDKEFSDSKKKMILRLICKNKFNENEVAHACINVDMSAGFVFTTSAVCLYDKEGFYCLNQKARCTNLIIPYANIQEFTEANFTLTLKDGNSFSIEVPKDQRDFTRKDV